MSAPRFRPMVLPRFSLASVLGTLVLAAPGWGWADYCEGRVQAAMTQMQEQLTSPVGGAERDSMQQALMSLCADALQAGGGQTPMAARSDAPQGPDLPQDDVAEEETENSSLFGIEFKKADKDSAGNERLKRKL